jgi:predicted RNase H-like HicB family nuclease
MVLPRPIVVRAEWDAEARAWVATSPDVEAFVTEAETIERLREKAPGVLSDLAQELGLDIDGADIEYIAYARDRLSVAA